MKKRDWKGGMSKRNEFEKLKEKSEMELKKRGEHEKKDERKK